MFSPCSAKRRASDKDLPVQLCNGSGRLRATTLICQIAEHLMSKYVAVRQSGHSRSLFFLNVSFVLYYLLERPEHKILN